MRALLLLAMSVLLAAVTSAAALPVCTDCLLGVYDDSQLTRVSGTAGPFELKSVYVGIRLPDGMRIDTLSFSAAYPIGFSVIDWSSYVPGVTLTPAGSGIRVEWPVCIAGTRLLFRVRVLGIGILRDAILRLQDATASGCDGAQAWRVPAGCYILNPSGPPVACGVETAPSTWSLVKELFR